MEKTVLISMPIEDFQSVIIDCVNSCLKHNPKAELPNPSEETYISRKEACEILSISLPTLAEWTKNGTIPALRIGTRVRYRKIDVINSMKSVKTSK